ncbi:hypothetical protein RIR_jg16458.t1 [Rhizophagus irregularis DAOM 181602=DAOM 197198]|nr:hypothetical protein RIR_jg16458.t1 [Rhizophagus irregularis DAOM 181602=DAOM 197198]
MTVGTTTWCREHVCIGISIKITNIIYLIIKGIFEQTKYFLVSFLFTPRFQLLSPPSSCESSGRAASPILIYLPLKEALPSYHLLPGLKQWFSIPFFVRKMS